MPFFQQFPKTIFDFEGSGIETNVIDIFRFVKTQELYTDELAVYTYYQVKNGDRADVVSNLLYDTPDYYWTFFVINEHLKSGLSGWPMSPDMFDKYIEQEYPGMVIMTRPYITRNTDKIITGYPDSLAGRFTVGETVVGSQSGATGQVVKVDSQLSQLVLKNIVAGPLGPFKANELIIGQSSSDSVTSYAVYDYRDAPHHYELPDGTISYNALHINESTLFIDGQLVNNIIDPAVADTALNAISNYEYETQLNDERGNLRVIRKELIYDFVKTFKEKLNA